MDRLPDHSPNQAEAKKPAAFLSQEGTDGPVRGAHSVPFMTLLQPHFPVTTERLRIATLSEEERDQAYEWLVGTHLGDSLEIPRNLTSAQFRWILVQAKDFSLFTLRERNTGLWIGMSGAWIQSPKKDWAAILYGLCKNA